MFEGLKVFQTARMMAEHAGARHAVVARNMANADTPGYRAQDVTPFREMALRREAGGTGLRATRPGHLAAPPAALPAAALREDTLTDPNGNGVSLELEMLKSVEAKRQHDRALAIYRSALEIVRTSLGRR